VLAHAAGNSATSAAMTAIRKQAAIVWIEGKTLFFSTIVS
jgi:hypothetical protein